MKKMDRTRIQKRASKFKFEGKAYGNIQNNMYYKSCREQRTGQKNSKEYIPSFKKINSVTLASQYTDSYF
jgi:hypothetical protein